MLSGMAVWPGDAPVEIATRDAGEYRITGMSLSAHTGTHVDAPCHFLQGGAGVDGLELKTLVGPARVVRLNDVKQIGPVEIARLPLEGVERLLIDTCGSTLTGDGEFDTSFISLTSEGAHALVGRGVRLVGIDSLSVDLFDAPGHPAHRALMAAGVVIIEGLNLSGVPVGDYELLCLPLKMVDSDGAPARVVLREI
jgi:arylformamidase